MQYIKDLLKQRAYSLHGEKVRPCGQKKDLDECFTEYEDKVLFWFNLDDNSTRMLVHKIRNTVPVAQQDRVEVS